MAEPVRRRHRRRVVAAVVGCAVVAAAVAGAVVVASSDDQGDAPAAFGTDHGTVPTDLDAAGVQRIGRAFGITGRPEHTASGWEVEDDLRALYLDRTESAWYAQFTNSAALVHPEADRSTVCASPTPPLGCAVPGVRFVEDVGEPPPTASAAVASARRTLGGAGVIDRRWESFVIGPSLEGVPCRTGVAPQLDCTRQVVSTQAVMLTRDLGPDRTALHWAVIVGPDGDVLSATGRFGRPDTG